MIRYVWKGGLGDNPGLAQAVGEKLNEIERQHGEVTPQLVLEEARSSNSLLHQFFNWDDEAAANAHRLWQARQLICRVHVKIIDDGKPKPAIRAFVNLRRPEEGQSYIGTVNAMSNEFQRAQLLRRAEDDLMSWRRKYDDLVEFASVFSAIDRRASRKVRAGKGA